jgi:fructokinase
VAYDYIEFIPEYHVNLINEARIIYFGSLVQRTGAGCENLQAFISHNASKKLNFYDINLRPGCYNHEIIEKSLSQTDILKLNTGELEKLMQMRSLKMENEKFVHYLKQTHSIQTVSLTKGELGSELFINQGSFSSASADVIKVVDSVGAGDAYAAMLAAGMLKNWSPPVIMERASLFASRICEIKGAIPESKSFYEPFKSLFGSSENAIP